MDFGDFMLRLAFLAQNGVGVLGNTLLLSSYASTACAGHMQRPTHLIVANMATANFLVLFFKGIPQMAFTWGVVYVLGDAACKLVYYIHRMARGLSLCTTCLLSVFPGTHHQPRRRPVGAAQGHSSEEGAFLVPSVLGVQPADEPLYSSENTGPSAWPQLQQHAACSSETPKTAAAKHAVLLTFPDVAFMVLVAVASAYMVLLLHRHHRRVRHVHSHTGAHRLSPETKATRSTLLLAGTFIFFYFTNSGLTISGICFPQSHLWLQHAPTSGCSPLSHPQPRY